MEEGGLIPCKVMVSVCIVCCLAFLCKQLFSSAKAAALCSAFNFVMQSGKVILLKTAGSLFVASYGSCRYCQREGQQDVICLLLEAP